MTKLSLKSELPICVAAHNIPTLFVLLAALPGFKIRPAHKCIAPFAMQVCDRMQARQQLTVLCFSDGGIDGRVEKVGFAIST